MNEGVALFSCRRLFMMSFGQLSWHARSWMAEWASSVERWQIHRSEAGSRRFSYGRLDGASLPCDVPSSCRSFAVSWYGRSCFCCVRRRSYYRRPSAQNSHQNTWTSTSADQLSLFAFVGRVNLRVSFVSANTV